MTSVDLDSFTKNDRIFLFKSPGRRAYKHQLLTILGLPNGCCFTTEYRKKYVSEDIWNEALRAPRKFQGKLGILFCVDLIEKPKTNNQKDDPELLARAFYPIRECEVQEFKPRGRKATVTYKVGNYLECQGDPDKWSDEFRRRYGQENLPPNSKDGFGTWVIFGKKLTMINSITQDRSEDAFQSLAENRLTEVSAFKDSTFIQITGLFKKNGKSSHVPRKINEKVGFELESGSSYILEIYVSHPSIDDPEGRTSSNLRFEFNKKYLESHEPDNLLFSSAYEHYDIEFTCKESLKENKTDLRISSFNKEDRLDIPHFEIPLKIKPSTWSVWILPVILATLFGIALALNELATFFLPPPPPATPPSLLFVGLRWFGGFLSFWAVLFISRRFR